MASCINGGLSPEFWTARLEGVVHLTWQQQLIPQSTYATEAFYQKGYLVEKVQSVLRGKQESLSSTKTLIHNLSWNGFWTSLEATEWALRNSRVRDGHRIMTAGNWAQIQGCLSLLITSSTIFFQAYVHCSRYVYLTFKCLVRLQVGRVMLYE